jgi:hypothetical protein
MKNAPEFEQIREETEAKQRSTLWEDRLGNGRSVDEFLWKGDPKAKPIQRAGLLVFGFTFFLIAIGIASIPFQKKFEDGWTIDFLLALFSLLIAICLFRNAFLRSPKHEEHEKLHK